MAIAINILPSITVSGSHFGYPIGSDNIFTGISPCELKVYPILNYYHFAPPPITCTPFGIPPTNSGTLPCPAADPLPTVPVEIHAHIIDTLGVDSLVADTLPVVMDSISADTFRIVPDSMTIAELEQTALNHDTFPGLQDTNSVLAKYGVMTILRENPYLLSSDSILHHFYDSMITAPMGKILAIDSSINFSSSPLSVTTYTSLVSSLGSVVPANNIEANMQIVTADYLYFLRYDTLLLSALSNLRILANKCPDWDGVGVYEARGLLTYFDSVGTVYNDSCYSGPHALREPKKNSIGNTDFNLYPNPNNGGFTVSYQLFKGQTGYLTIYSMLGAKVAEFKLDANMDKMNINAGNLTEGIYLYGISINNTTVKRDKIIIIK